jgi:hypothetical protein
MVVQEVKDRVGVPLGIGGGRGVEDERDSGWGVGGRRERVVEV